MIATKHAHRIKSAAAVAVIHGLLGYALIVGLATGPARRDDAALKLFDVAEPPSPPPEPLAPAERVGEDAPAPENLKAEAAPVVAPEARVPVATPVPAAPVAGTGSQSSAGAGDRPGAGTGAGGTGTGLGGGIAVRSRQIGGRFRRSDYPRGAVSAGIEGTTVARFAVDPDGRARDCAVLKSSGSAELDATTCSVIERRYRFRPARTASGEAVTETRVWEQIWWIDR